MVATLMQALDSTIANVALPYMQGSLSATSDQITWVLTSYIVAAAIMTAPVGWLSARFGRKRLFIVCLVGFTVASMLCGVAQSLEQMVLFRLLQGVFGAALVPLSQATMLDIYPPEQRGSAMALWGVGVMVGPILGPTLGGYLTDLYNWRFVFYVNLPFGILATARPDDLPARARRPSRACASTGSASACSPSASAPSSSCSTAARTRTGSARARSSSRPCSAGSALYLFIVHLLTAERPFLSPRLFTDRNFAASLAVMFSVGMILLASSALLAPWLQILAGYPVAAAGLVLAPRGLGTMAAMMISGRLDQPDGPALADGARHRAALLQPLASRPSWTPDVDRWTIIFNTIIRAPASASSSSPCRSSPSRRSPPELRTDATSLLSLVRNVGSAVGVSATSALLARNIQIAHADIAAHVTPFSRRSPAASTPARRMLDPTTAKGAALLDGMINQQASIIAYLDDFKAMLFVTAPPPPAAPADAPPQGRRRPDPAHAAMD